MTRVILSTALSLFGLFAFAGNPPANYPAVNGVVKKIDLVNLEITIKHETIPNLNMPGMTMPFLIQDPQMVSGLKVGDQVKFAADQNSNGDLVLIWIEKAQPAPISDQTAVSCTGIANTTPKTNIEVEIRPGTYSTIRYEYAEGALKGTSYISSIGNMTLKKAKGLFIYESGGGKFDSKLSFETAGSQIQNAKFYNFSAGMDFDPVQCAFEI